MAKYLAKVGLDYDDRRVEPGDTVDDIPIKSVKWLRECGAIVLAKEADEEAAAAEFKRAVKEAKGTDLAPEEIITEEVS